MDGGSRNQLPATVRSQASGREVRKEVLSPLLKLPFIRRAQGLGRKAEVRE